MKYLVVFMTPHNAPRATKNVSFDDPHEALELAREWVYSHTKNLPPKEPQRNFLEIDDIPYVMFSFYAEPPFWHKYSVMVAKVPG